jgi:predicted phosphodiesterase
MRVALLSDIHGNAFALDAVLKDAHDQNIAQYVCLGDVVEFGPQPSQALTRVIELGCPIVMGNTDERMTGDRHAELDRLERTPGIEMELWCYDQLSVVERNILRGFAPNVQFSLDNSQAITCFHGSPRSNKEIILATTPDDELLPMFAECSGKVCAGGHTHTQMLRRWQDWLIINPGSIGLPFVKKADGTLHRPPFSEYAILEVNDGALSVDLRRVPFDVPAMLKIASTSDMPHADVWIAEWM